MGMIEIPIGMVEMEVGGKRSAYCEILVIGFSYAVDRKITPFSVYEFCISRTYPKSILNIQGGYAMLFFKKTLLALVMVSILSSLVACEREGPMERTGEKVDEAAEDTKDAVKDATN